MTFGTLIKQRREELNLTRWKLGKLSGIGLTHIKRIEDGKDCCISTAARLLQSLSVQNINSEHLQV